MMCILLFCGLATANVPFRFVHIKNRSGLRSQNGIDLNQPFCTILMYRTFADAKSLGCLPDGGVMFNNVASDVDRPLLNILFQKKTP